MRKGGEFNFVWLFALIAGAAILFLAIFGALKTADTERFKSDTEVAREISILTNPLQAGFASGSFGKIEFNDETWINNVCLSQKDDGKTFASSDATPNQDSEPAKVFFGKNDISVSTRSDIGQEWNTAGGATSIYNKYIFSNTKNTGKDYYVFSKPFNFPYKVADIVFLTTANYCFVDAPTDIQKEIIGLNIPNIEISPNCTLATPIRVCFGAGGKNCEINVIGDENSGHVEKYGISMSYSGNLMYAAIFSDKGIYDCNVERLMQRTAKIAEELSEKAELLNSRGCGTNMKPHLEFWYSSTINADVNDLVELADEAKGIENENERELCGVW